LSAKLGRAGSLTVLISAGVIWVVAAFAGVMPVVEAEALARDADEQIRLAQSNGPAGPGALDAARLDHARHGLFSAFRLVPINADYAFRTAQAAAMVRGNDMVVRELLDAAHQADPLSVRYLRTRASFNLQSGDLPAAQADYLQCLRLDPNNLEIRLEYAHVLELQHQHAQAVDQYRTTLELDDKLAPDEIRRLSKDQVRQVEKWIEGQKK
jgi:tetratricopeptide (TPR) repeat protein